MDKGDRKFEIITENNRLIKMSNANFFKTYFDQV